MNFIDKICLPSAARLHGYSCNRNQSVFISLKDCTLSGGAFT